MGRCHVTTCMVNRRNVTRCTGWQSSKHTEVPCALNITQSTNLQLFRLYPAIISVHETYNRKITVQSVIQEERITFWDVTASVTVWSGGGGVQTRV